MDERNDDDNDNDLSKACQLGEWDRFVSEETTVDDVFAFDAPTCLLDSNPGHHETDKENTDDHSGPKLGRGLRFGMRENTIDHGCQCARGTQTDQPSQRSFC
ncbi:hypothetical protein [Mesorhizobium sp. M0243]|uniref:hypothetical protein n=1 Tax=Mesorhizobium sp. M0243 TaxID=2956925 RepID=UPI00333D2D49